MPDYIILAIGLVLGVFGGWALHAALRGSDSFTPDEIYVMGWNEGRADMRRTTLKEFTDGLWGLLEEEQEEQAEMPDAMRDGICLACGREGTEADRLITVNGDLIHYSHRADPESGYYRGY